MSNLNQLFNVSEGNVYLAHYATTVGSALNICFTTPPIGATGVPRYKTIRCYPVFGPHTLTDGASYLVVYEAPTTFSGGTAKDWYNLNRNAGTVPDVLDVANTKGKFAYNATQSGGTKIYEETSLIEGGSSLMLLRTPLLLKPETDYAFVITQEAGDASLSIILQQKEN